MALIELNLEKPALKRTEFVGEAEEEAHAVNIKEERPTEHVDRIDTEESAEAETGSKSSSRARRVARRAAMAGAMTGAAVAARKIRQRRKQSSTQTEVDEDWQTPSN